MTTREGDWPLKAAANQGPILPTSLASEALAHLPNALQEAQVADTSSLRRLLRKGYARSKRRERWSIGKVTAEVLGKRWTEAIIPLLVLMSVVLYTSIKAPVLLSTGSASDLLRIFGEFGLICIGVTLVLVAGGLDISVGAMYGLSAIVCYDLFELAGWPVWLVVVNAVFIGAVMGITNGLLIVILNTKPFLITLVTLVVFGGIQSLLDTTFSQQATLSNRSDTAWSILGQGFLAGVPTSFFVLVVLAGIGHAYLGRSRWGIWTAAVGSNRRAARHAGIPVNTTITWAYTLSGVLAALAGVMGAARLNTANANTGGGLEFLALTAVVVGGVSLFGGNGTVTRALVGGTIVLLLSRALLVQNYSAAAQNMVLGLVLLLSVAVDTRFTINRLRIIHRLYVSPIRRSYSQLENLTGAYERNGRLAEAEAIGLETIEGPEDIVIAPDGALYAGTREGEVFRFDGPDWTRQEVHCRIGGRPVGLAMAPDGSVLQCVTGLGLHRIHRDGSFEVLADQVKRSFGRLYDDSRIRVADDLDVTRNGTVYFSDYSTRYDAADWIVEALEGRPNGRLLSYEPQTGRTTVVLNRLISPNGVAICHDEQSLLVNQSWNCDILRYWFEGPKAGKLETFATLPGYPDNINRSSDGGYWVALAGMRTPMYDLLMKNPRFRRGMVRKVAADEWLFPQMNVGCIVKLNRDGTAILSLWDPTGRNHPVVTSMREYQGHLFIAGLENNRIGRLKLTDEERTAAQRDAKDASRASFTVGAS